MSWTAADQAELDALTWALADGYFQHKEHCARCAAGYPPCPHVGRAIAEVADWVHMRKLLSRAQHLRQLQEAA